MVRSQRFRTRGLTASIGKASPTFRMSPRKRLEHLSVQATPGFPQPHVYTSRLSFRSLSASAAMPKYRSGKTQAPRRSHTFGGCGTCRRRHVKCDQVHPTCLTCKAVGVDCEGYQTDLKWMPTPDTSIVNISSDGEQRPQPARRHLYSGNLISFQSPLLLWLIKHC